MNSKILLLTAALCACDQQTPEQAANTAPLHSLKQAELTASLLKRCIEMTPHLEGDQRAMDMIARDCYIQALGVTADVR